MSIGAGLFFEGSLKSPFWYYRISSGAWMPTVHTSGCCFHRLSAYTVRKVIGEAQNGESIDGELSEPLC